MLLSERAIAGDADAYHFVDKRGAWWEVDLRHAEGLLDGERLGHLHRGKPFAVQSVPERADRVVVMGFAAAFQPPRNLVWVVRQLHLDVLLGCQGHQRLSVLPETLRPGH